MSNIKQFCLTQYDLHAVPGSSFAIEKSPLRPIEQRLETFLGVRFLASEFAATKSHGGCVYALEASWSGGS